MRVYDAKIVYSLVSLGEDVRLDRPEKVVEYLRMGVRVVLVLDPASETASLYRPEVLQELLHKDAELTVPDVLPGFAVQVASLFE